MPKNANKRVFLVCLLSASFAAPAWAKDFDPENLWASRSPENAQLLRRLKRFAPTQFYILDGGPARVRTAAPATFHGVPIIAAKPPLDAANGTRFKASLKKVLRSSNGGQSACFFPRHGVTLSDGRRSVDILMCFECRKFIVYDASGAPLYWSGFNAPDEESVWTGIFDRSSVRNEQELPSAQGATHDDARPEAHD